MKGLLPSSLPVSLNSRKHIAHQTKPEGFVPVQEHEFVLVVDAQVPAGGDVPEAHGVEPVDVPAGPLGARQLEPPERARLRCYGAPFVDYDTGR